jgi:antitoxin ParD1/3/4
MTNINISVSESMKAYIEEQVSQRGYSTTSEYFQDLILQDQKSKAQEHLETLLLEGLDSGTATPISDTDWYEIRESVRSRIANQTDSSRNNGHS